MFSRLSTDQLSNLLPFFSSLPKFVLFSNAVKFELGNVWPNHPCNFYLLENGNIKYYFCFRHDLLPDKNGPILMIGWDGADGAKPYENDVITGLTEIRELEPSFDEIWILVATSDLSTPSRNFLKTKSNRVEYDFVHCNNFYIPRSAYSKVQDSENPQLPSDFHLGSIRVSDANIVNSTWKFATPEDVLQQKEKITRLPSSCIYYKDVPVAFEMIGLHGQLNHQYTFPEYRNRGFGTVVENELIAKCIRAKFTPTKSVELTNETVLKRSLEHSLFEVVRDKDGEIMIFDYAVFRSS